MILIQQCFLMRTISINTMAFSNNELQETESPSFTSQQMDISKEEMLSSSVIQMALESGEFLLLLEITTGTLCGWCYFSYLSHKDRQTELSLKHVVFINTFNKH